MGTLRTVKCDWRMSLSFKGNKSKLPLVPLSLSSSLLIPGVLFLLSVFFVPASAHLNLSKQCGDYTCADHQYCREFDHTCRSCGDICKEGSNNFSKDTCENGCQDYLHDERYIRVQGTSSSPENGKDLGSLYQSLQRDVLVLKILVGVCLFVIALILAAFTAFLVYFWRRIYNSSTMGSGVTSDKNKSDDKESKNKKDGKNKGIDLPVIYDNKYGLCNSPEMPRVRRGQSQSPTKTDDQSPSKVSTDTMNSLNSAKTNGGVTMSTLVNSSNNGSTGTNTPNGINNNRFRREPSESTIPEYMCDNASLRGQGQGQTPITGPIYTHHV